MPYTTDLSDAEWTLLEPYLPTSKSTGRPRMHGPREMLNAIFYELLLKAACDRLPRLSHLWVDAGYEGRGKRWAEEALGLSVEVVHRSRKPIPEEVARI